MAGCEPATTNNPRRTRHPDVLVHIGRIVPVQVSLLVATVPVRVRDVVRTFLIMISLPYRTRMCDWPKLNT